MNADIKSGVLNAIKLARIDADPSLYLDDVTKMVNMVGQLATVDLTYTIEDQNQPTNVFREDVVKPSISNALYNSPESKDGYFVVPKVVE